VTLVADPKYLPPREQLEDDHAQFLKDQRGAYTDLRSQVVWHSAPLAAETVLAGRARVHLQVVSDQPDADLWVDLFEVLPDGSAIFLASGVSRLRYRRGGVAAVPMVSGKPERVDFAPLTFFARSIGKGSRLRLVVNAGPMFDEQRNSHTGGDLASEPASAGRIAKITIVTGPGSGSTLELPQPDPALLKRSEDAAKPAAAGKTHGS